jgi:putative hemolysin
MKSTTLFNAVGILLLAAVIGGQAVRAQTQSQGNNARVYRGEVSDSQCALNVHSLTRSHQEMLKSKAMGGTANTCSLYCIEHLGGDLVLVSGKDGKDVYHLDRPDLIHGFEGQKVKITGLLDSQNTHLHVLKIELQPQP